MDDDELSELLRTARVNNALLGITGLLLYKGGNFMQALEGPEDAVDSLYKKIERDARHKGAIRLIRETVATRQFGDWSMGFQNADRALTETLAGFSPFLYDRLTSDAYRRNPQKAYKMLLMFRDRFR